MDLDPAVWVAIVAFIGSVVSITLTNRFAARSARAALVSAEQQKAIQVDSEAFKRARESYDAAIAEQERRIARLHVEIDRDRALYAAELLDCRTRIQDLQRRSNSHSKSRREIAALKEWAGPLMEAALAAGLAVPTPPVRLNTAARGSDDDDEGY